MRDVVVVGGSGCRDEMTTTKEATFNLGHSVRLTPLVWQMRRADAVFVRNGRHPPSRRAGCVRNLAQNLPRRALQTVATGKRLATVLSRQRACLLSRSSWKKSFGMDERSSVLAVVGFESGLAALFWLMSRWIGECVLSFAACNFGWIVGF